MAFGPARPPVTEDVAEVIAKDIKSGEGRGATSEVPLAFQTGARMPPIAPEVLSGTRKQLTIAAAVVVVLLLLLWLLA